MELSNLGPLRSAKMKLADLTLLMGDNNSGKTFFATVLHRILDSRSSARWSKPGGLQRLPSQVRDWIRHLEEGPDEEGGVPESPAQRPTDATLRWAKGLATEALQAFGAEVRDSIQYAYATDASDLRRRTPSRHAVDCYLRIRNEMPGWEVEIRFDDEAVSVKPPDTRTWLSAAFGENDIGTVGGSPFGRNLPSSRMPGVGGPTSRGHIFRATEMSLYHDWPRRAVHLPAGRTGIMHSYQVLVSNVVRQSAAAGIRPIEVAPLPGTSADFLSLMIAPQRGRTSYRMHPELRSIVKAIEQDIRAEIVIDRRAGLADIVAVTPEGPFPLWRTSSMISETAPLVLLLKNSTSAGDHLTIDEPEAHLHPNMQRRFALSLMRLVNHGIGMVLTTHSDCFLDEISSLIRARELARSQARRELDTLYRLDPSNISALRFVREKRWCVARPVDIDAIDGVDGSTFTEVMEEQYEKSARQINDLMRLSVQ